MIITPYMLELVRPWAEAESKTVIEFEERSSIINNHIGTVGKNILTLRFLNISQSQRFTLTNEYLWIKVYDWREQKFVFECSLLEDQGETARLSLQDMVVIGATADQIIEERPLIERLVKESFKDVSNFIQEEEIKAKARLCFSLVENLFFSQNDHSIEKLDTHKFLAKIWKLPIREIKKYIPIHQMLTKSESFESARKQINDFINVVESIEKINLPEQATV